MRRNSLEFISKSLFVVLGCSIIHTATPASVKTDGMIEELPEREAGTVGVRPPHSEKSPAVVDGPIADDEYSTPSEPLEEIDLVPEPKAAMAEPVVVKEVDNEETEECGPNYRISPGVTTWFFDEESTLPGAALYFDYWRSEFPLNYRVGVEGRHMNLDQEAADFAQEYPTKETDITFIRIPFAVEYMRRVGDKTTLYLGGGPDIIHTANDISETAVGGHLAARLHYGFDESWGVAVEGGYMWGEIDGEDDDVVLDNAYVTPTVTYTF